MTEPTETSGNSRSKWIRPVLFVSLAINLLVVGAVAGIFLRHDPSARERGAYSKPLRDLGYGPFGSAFSKSDRYEIGRAMLARDGDLKTNRDEVRQQFLGLLGLLRATPYDADAVQEIVESQRSKLNERQIIGQQVFLDRINAMSDKERASFARRLEKSLRRSLRHN